MRNHGLSEMPHVERYGVMWALSPYAYMPPIACSAIGLQWHSEPVSHDDGTKVHAFSAAIGQLELILGIFACYAVSGVSSRYAPSTPPQVHHKHGLECN